jgi:hypothetical protein
VTESPGVNNDGLADIPEDYYRVLRDMELLANRADLEKQLHTLSGQRCYVCYIDIDGFRERVIEEPGELFALYARKRTFMINTFWRAGAQWTGTGIELAHYDHLLWPYMFSDSWFFASVDDTELSLRQVSSAAAGLFMRCFEMKFVARGGISIGKTWWHPAQPIVLGPALVRAYEIARRLECFGVVVDKEVSDACPADAVTACVGARMKCGSEITTTDRCFAFLHGFRMKGRKFITDSYLTLFDEMADEYCHRRDAEERIKERYRCSRGIVEAMITDRASPAERTG